MKTLIEQNLMNQKGYSPYCGTINNCTFPRTRFNGLQFKCPCCHWTSNFPKEFIKGYKEKWNIK